MDNNKLVKTKTVDYAQVKQAKDNLIREVSEQFLNECLKGNLLQIETAWAKIGTSVQEHFNHFNSQSYDTQIKKIAAVLFCQRVRQDIFKYKDYAIITAILDRDMPELTVFLKKLLTEQGLDNMSQPLLLHYVKRAAYKNAAIMLMFNKDIHECHDDFPKDIEGQLRTCFHLVMSHKKFAVARRLIVQADGLEIQQDMMVAYFKNFFETNANKPIPNIKTAQEHMRFLLKVNPIVVKDLLLQGLLNKKFPLYMKEMQYAVLTELVGMTEKGKDQVSFSNDEKQYFKKILLPNDSFLQFDQMFLDNFDSYQSLCDQTMLFQQFYLYARAQKAALIEQFKTKLTVNYLKQIACQFDNEVNKVAQNILNGSYDTYFKKQSSLKRDLVFERLIHIDTSLKSIKNEASHQIDIYTQFHQFANRMRKCVTMDKLLHTVETDLLNKPSYYSQKIELMFAHEKWIDLMNLLSKQTDSSQVHLNIYRYFLQHIFNEKDTEEWLCDMIERNPVKLKKILLHQVFFQDQPAYWCKMRYMAIKKLHLLSQDQNHFFKLNDADKRLLKYQIIKGYQNVPRLKSIAFNDLFENMGDNYQAMTSLLEKRVEFNRKFTGFMKTKQYELNEIIGEKTYYSDETPQSINTTLNNSLLNIQSAIMSGDYDKEFSRQGEYQIFNDIYRQGQCISDINKQVVSYKQFVQYANQIKTQIIDEISKYQTQQITAQKLTETKNKVLETIKAKVTTTLKNHGSHALAGSAGNDNIEDIKKSCRDSIVDILENSAETKQLSKWDNPVADFLIGLAGVLISVPLAGIPLCFKGYRNLFFNSHQARHCSNIVDKCYAIPLVLSNTMVST